MRETNLSTGIVYFVGAGPGDAGLLTLRGAELIRDADVVLYDGLVNAELLSHAAEPQRCHSVGKHGGQRIWTQGEINERLVAEASSGKRVVRLKGGDPVIFGRLAEECDALRAAGIPFEIVPGITAALAAGAYAGVPITHRGFASAVALITGHEEETKPETAIDWEALARFPGTLVIYMGVTTARLWSRALLDAGKSPSTPAAIIRRCSWHDQETIQCTLADVAEHLTPANKLRPPVIVIVGSVVDLRQHLDWFSQRPLFGQTILLTRPEHQSANVAHALRQRGAEVLLQPAIRIEPPTDSKPLIEAIERLHETDWVVFSSSNGVDALMRQLLDLGKDLRALGRCRLACIGPGTAAALARYHLKPDLVPDEFRAEGLAAALAPRARDQHVLLVRASRGREVLAEELQRAGAQVSQFVAYQSLDVTEPYPDVLRALEESRIDWVTVTSSAIARSLTSLFGVERLRKARLASISSITSETLRDLGLTVAAEAREATMESLVEAIIDAQRPTGA